MRYRRKQSTQIISVQFAESAACGCVLFLPGWVGPVTMKKRKKRLHVLDSDLETKQLPLRNQTFFFPLLYFVLVATGIYFFLSYNLRPTFWTRVLSIAGLSLGNKPRQKVPEIQDWWTLVSLPVKVCTADAL